MVVTSNLTTTTKNLSVLVSVVFLKVYLIPFAMNKQRLEAAALGPMFEADWSSCQQLNERDFCSWGIQMGSFRNCFLTDSSVFGF